MLQVEQKHFPLLKLKSNEEFVWGQEQQQAFEAIKEYLVTPLVLTPPKQGKPLKLYILATQESIGIYWPRTTVKAKNKLYFI